MRRSMILVAVAAMVLAATCKRQASVATPPAPSAVRENSSPGQDPEKEETMIVGALKPTVEPGGWILETDDGEFLLLRLGRYVEEPWFQAGNRLRARGRIDRDVMTTFMQGTPFIVRELEPVTEPGGSAPSPGSRVS